MIFADMFDNEERYIINKAFEHTSLAGQTKERILGNFAFAREISVEQDIQEVLDGLIAKINRISDDEWGDLKQYVPFAVAVDAGDEGFPQDEAV